MTVPNTLTLQTMDSVEPIWFDRIRVEEAEYRYQQHLAEQHSGLVVKEGTSSILNEIARARQNIQNSLHAPGEGLQVGTSVGHAEVFARLTSLEQENKDLRKVTQDLRALVKKLESRVSSLEKGGARPANSPAKPAQPQDEEEDDDDDSDDDIDLFGDTDEEEDAAAEKLKEQRVKAYQEKKGKKAPLVAKSMIVLDVKPWDDETDMADVEKSVRSITTDGLTWGQSKLVPLAYGIKKLQISCVVEDDKVGTDFLEEKITEFEDFVQSVDIAAFNKL